MNSLRFKTQFWEIDKSVHSEAENGKAAAAKTTKAAKPAAESPFYQKLREGTHAGRRRPDQKLGRKRCSSPFLSLFCPRSPDP